MYRGELGRSTRGGCASVATQSVEGTKVIMIGGFCSYPVTLFAPAGALICTE